MSGGEVALRNRIAEAAAWRLAGLLFQRPRGGWHQEVMALAAEVDDPILREAAREAAGAQEETYLAVLGPGGVVSPREVGYCEQGEPGHILADIAAFYEAFAYRSGSLGGGAAAGTPGALDPDGVQSRQVPVDQCEPVTERNTKETGHAVAREDPVDHIAVEADFLGYMHLKEAFAREGSDVEAAETTALGASSFVNAHLGTWAHELARRLEATGPVYLARTADAIASRISR